MKRITAILFILLANICLLAYASIVHHHHNRMIVAISYEHTDSLNLSHYVVVKSPKKI